MTDHAPEHRLDTEAKAARGIMEALREAQMADDADLTHDTIEGETGLLDAIQAADAEMRDCDVTIAGCKSVESGLKARRQRAEARKDKLRAAIEQALLIAEITVPMRLPTGTFSLSRVAPSVIVDDESQIPARFFVPQPPKLDKAALKDAAAKGPVPGCHMTNGSVSLNVRRK